MSKKYEIDMTQGSLLINIIRFSVPLIISGILQILFNAADIIIVGRFATDGSRCLAAVGSTGNLTALIINFFIGFSVGTSVRMAINFGSRDYVKIEKTVHTSIAVGIVFGIFVTLLGLFVSKPMLHLMATPDEILGLANLYMKIICIGFPAQMVYNFGSAVLRSIGDTKRPLWILIFAGIINVIANLIFVVIFHLDIAGVAMATVISHYISAALVIVCLMKSTDYYRLYINKIKLYKDELIEILKIGLPAGVQNTLFSIANVTIQSSVNFFGPVAMAGSSVAGNIEGFIYVAMYAVAQASTTACGQNLGAKNLKRIKQSVIYSVISVSVIGILLSVVTLVFKDIFFGFYSNDAEVCRYAAIRATYMFIPYFLCGIMDVLSGAVRGLGYSTLPMAVSVVGVCLFRILWITTIFQISKTLGTLFFSYTVSWTITSLAHFVCLVYAIKKLKKSFSSEQKILIGE